MKSGLEHFSAGFNYRGASFYSEEFLLDVCCLHWRVNFPHRQHTSIVSVTICEGEVGHLETTDEEFLVILDVFQRKTGSVTLTLHL